ncbi:MAG: hypothetical protein HDR00_00570 [Lachnospiraceae bacterium]|nr:hypothetical protein [Lachnospiraceae bacterium]
MAFINEKLSSIQKEDFKKKKIKNPRHPHEILSPNFWTIDHERDICLINIGAYHDLPEEELFLFLYHSDIFLFTLQICTMSEQQKAWKFKKYITLNNSNQIEEKQLISVFKEALTEYKYNGLPDTYKQQFEMEIQF